MKAYGKWMYRSTFSWPQHKLEVSGQPHTQPLYPQGKSPWYPLCRRLGGPKSRSRQHGEVKVLAPPELELRLLRPPARSQSLYWLSCPCSNHEVTNKLLKCGHTKLQLCTLQPYNSGISVTGIFSQFMIANLILSCHFWEEIRFYLNRHVNM
jgi:hypothetical protein